MGFVLLGLGIYDHSKGIGQIIESVFPKVGLGEGNILVLGFLLALALELGPGLPLGLSFEVKHAWLVGVVVTNRPLLEEGIDLQELVVRHLNVVIS